MITLHPTYIEKQGVKEFVVIPVEEFNQVAEVLEDLEDLMELRKAKRTSSTEQTIPWNDAKKKLGLD